MQKDHVKCVFLSPRPEVGPENLTAWLFYELIFYHMGQLPFKDLSFLKLFNLSEQQGRMLINQGLAHGFFIECYESGATEIPPRNERK